MKTEPIVPARIEFAADAPRAPVFDDVYHPRSLDSAHPCAGALQQARAVFLAGNGLPERWRGRARFTILETGFGLGHNFLATWAAWRDDPQRCERLHFVSIEKHPPTRDDLARALDACELPSLARQLVDAWPPLTPNLHALRFDAGRVQLLLAFGDAAPLAREIVARVDAFFLDGFAPARNPAMWTTVLFESLARLAAPGATAATWSAARAVRDGLAAAGFEVRAAPGPGAKRDITLARYAPCFERPTPPGRVLPGRAPAHAIVVGAGLAGAATARALAAQGVPCSVLDAQAQPATQASGNPAGLFHGTVGHDDTPHTRWFRAASFHAARWVRETPGAGAADGLLRLQAEDPAGATAARSGIEAMRALLERQALPPQYLHALDAAGASARAGLTLAQPAWLFTEGGWADPAALVRAALDASGVTWLGHAEVAAVQRHADAWHACDRAGRTLAEAPLLVLCNAADALSLAALPAHWTQRVRGQITSLRADETTLARGLPRLPLACGSYVISLPSSAQGPRLLLGATQQAHDDDAQVRAADHAENLERAAQLLGVAPAQPGARLEGRVGWRVVTRDRLPLAGRAPDLAAPLPARRDAPRLVVRRQGLFILTALGSRGLTSAALAGELIAAQACGAPWPVEADLADALDPARFALG